MVMLYSAVSYGSALLVAAGQRIMPYVYVRLAPYAMPRLMPRQPYGFSDSSSAMDWRLSALCCLPYRLGIACYAGAIWVYGCQDGGASYIYASWMYSWTTSWIMGQDYSLIALDNMVLPIYYIALVCILALFLLTWVPAVYTFLGACLLNIGFSASSCLGCLADLDYIAPPWIQHYAADNMDCGHSNALAYNIWIAD